MPTSRTLVAIAVVCWHDRFLVGTRPAGSALAGYCEFPGGKVLPGEAPADAAVRECLEETGLAVSVVGEYAPCEHDYAHGQLTLRFFACEPRDGATAVRPPFRWLAREELSRLPFPPANAALLARLGAAGAG
ncbi:MAG: NUDIX domain-containing protein [Pirellulales bacterium]